ncbi:glycosyltransferase family 2 protein [Parabacteroides chongii]|uniref:glycosyltransferase family 2 protein n=1 Tax=Parabacteroides chongii TaxID=2685834 RepID=UPI00240E95B1|nr:glycosyltransferase family 2 protein [Parabacteroides chongii]WFE83089.1 glycosyltransferase family 2 protein [Parabacteroides chongii]
MRIPLISIIVPVYNVEKVLPVCLESILRQSFQDFELLLVDDGSSDKSGAICDDYQQKDDRIHVFHQVNGGVSSARNRGLREAKGEYLLFIDSDDWIQDDFFLLIQSYLGKFDIIFLGLDDVTFGGHSIQKRIPPFKISDNDNETLSEILYALFKIDLLGYMCSLVVRRNIVVEHSLKFNERFSLHEDSLFYFDCCMYASSFVSLAHASYKYVHYENEKRKTLSNKIPANYKEILQLRQEKMEELLSSIEMPKDKRHFIEGRLMYHFCRVSLDIAMSQKGRVIKSIKDCIVEFVDKEIVTCSAKEDLLHFLVKKRMPHMIFIAKKLLSIVK